MIDVEMRDERDAMKVGDWLEQNMPNPPFPEQQRWTMGYSQDGTRRFGIQFLNEQDATLFQLRWA